MRKYRLGNQMYFLGSPKIRNNYTLHFQTNPTNIQPDQSIYYSELSILFVYKNKSLVCRFLRIEYFLHIFTFYTREWKPKQILSRALSQLLSVCMYVDNARRRFFVRFWREKSAPFLIKLFYLFYTWVRI